MSQTFGLLSGMARSRTPFVSFTSTRRWLRASCTKLVARRSAKSRLIDSEQIVGLTLTISLVARPHFPIRDPALNFFDDKACKSVAINKCIGRRRSLASGTRMAIAKCFVGPCRDKPTVSLVWTHRPSH